MRDDYEKARKLGEKAFQQAVHEGRHPYLPVLDEFLDLKTCSRIHIGVMNIPSNLVIGTKTAGRQNAFACNFMPLLEKETEFGLKWSALYESQVEEGMRDAIVCYEYLHYFYVQEGNKRVSVANYLKMPSIAADITRLVPADLKETDAYAQFLKFFAVCPLYSINFTKGESYKEFAALLGKDLKTPWEETLVRRIDAAFYHFHEAAALSGLEGNESDAFLLYITVYGFDRLRYESTAIIRKNIEALKKELKVQAESENIKVKENPQAKKEAPLIDLRKILPVYSESRPLRISFLYDEKTEESGRAYDHEVGRLYLNKKFGSLVKTQCFEDLTDDEKLRAALEKASASSDMVFTVSPAMMKETLKAAILHPEVKYLNCSVNLSANAVRTYDVRMYEAKFLMGALAAMSTDNHKISYIADYPIFGNIASINAFAIGASLIDPQIKVYLAWSGVHDQDWLKELEYLDINVFAAEDLPSLGNDSTIYGLCRREPDGTIANLAAPVINWTKYYELLVSSVLEATWSQDKEGEEKPINYWWGMSAGVMDLTVSSRLPYSSIKMIQMMQESLIQGTLQPFAHELRAADHLIQKASAGRLRNEDIIRMDWLNENIIGVIPEYTRLSEGGKKLARVSGVKAAKEKG
ncbi:MAG: BMP family ABC transporter substrate-binding protein [Erysipelotrichaceae bacterium]|nr:BMP family ABC transporter substrate-binding protein [Erysipelotrichaceae bacterium]